MSGLEGRASAPPCQMIQTVRHIKLPKFWASSVWCSVRLTVPSAELWCKNNEQEDLDMVELDARCLFKTLAHTLQEGESWLYLRMSRRSLPSAAKHKF